jgi:polyhydroxybutyrate depolymerase
MKRLRRRVVVVLIVAAVAIVATTASRAYWARPMVGTVERQLVVGGVRRTYLLHAGGDAKPGRPLVLVLHGLGGKAAGLERRTRGTFDKLADRFGAVIVYPQASGERPHWGTWRVADSSVAPPPDDLGFLSALVDTLDVELRIDRKRVFAAGFSNGASMVYRLACDRPDLFAAVAPVAGGMSPDIAPPCRQGAPVSIIGMHGNADPVWPLDGAVRDGVAAWAKRDGCPPSPVSTPLPDTDPNDDTRTRADVYAPCAAGTEVAFYTIDGGGHAWPGEDSAPLAFRHRGNTPRDFDAAAVIWDFFQRHPKR